jgi:tetratricopeptide (TPR) repeat protein
MEEMQKWARLYPEDIFANHQLGFLTFYAFEDYEKAAEYLTHNVENRVKMFYSHYMMAWAQMCLGDYDKAREVAEIYVSEIEDHPEMRGSLSIAYLCQGEYDKAWAEIEKAIALGFDPAYWNDLIKGGILQAKGDLTGAESHFQKLAESRNVLNRLTGREYLGGLALLQGRYKEAAVQLAQALDIAEAGEDRANMSRLYTHLAYINLQSGNYEAALDACDKALENGPYSVDALNAIKLANQVKGLCQLRLNDIEAAWETAQNLEAAAEQDPSRLSMRYYLHLAGHVEMAKGNTIEAIKRFEEAASLLPAQNQFDLAGFKNSFRRTIYLASLAEAYFTAGDLEKAREAYESLTSLTIGRQHWGDLYVKAFYWLGRISERQGKIGEAISYYQHFLELWKDADPGLPEVADARERLAALQNN